MEYASMLLAASNIYAAHSDAKCSKAESRFERGLFNLFTQASNSGMAPEDIAVVASTAIAAMLTRSETIHSTTRPAASVGGNVVGLHSKASNLPL
jgi:hypothetical protein